LLTLAGVVGLVGWERLQRNAYAEERAAGSISNEQASASRGERAPTAPSQVT